jgi:hypothetical protein
MVDYARAPLEGKGPELQAAIIGLGIAYVVTGQTRRRNHRRRQDRTPPEGGGEFSFG